MAEKCCVWGLGFGFFFLDWRDYDVNGRFGLLVFTLFRTVQMGMSEKDCFVSCVHGPVHVHVHGPRSSLEIDQLAPLQYLDFITYSQLHLLLSFL